MRNDFENQREAQFREEPQEEKVQAKKAEREHENVRERKQNLEDQHANEHFAFVEEASEVRVAKVPEQRWELRGRARTAAEVREQKPRKF